MNSCYYCDGLYRTVQFNLTEDFTVNSCIEMFIMINYMMRDMM